MQLVMTASQLERVYDHLIQEDRLERFAYLYCSRRGEGTLLVEAVDPIPDEACSIQHGTAVCVDDEVELARLNDCLDREQVPVLLHSHPFSELPGFSGQDHTVFENYADWLGPLFPELTLGFAVLGKHGLDATVFRNLGTETREQLHVDIVGEWTLEEPVEVPRPDSSLPQIDRQRFDRSMRALGEEGQARLADTRVGIVGVGGLGSMVAEQLARLGVGEFLLVDPDDVEASNLPRLYGAYDHHVGRPKVDAVRAHLWQVNPDTTVDVHRARAQEVPDKELASCDVLIGAVDRVTARTYLNEFAVKHLTYFIDGGVRIDTESATETTAPTVTQEMGIVQLVAPGVNGCLSCLGRRDPETARLEQLDDDQVEAEIDRGYIEGEIFTPQPAVTPLNGLMASQVTRVFTKLVTGYTTPPDVVQYRGPEIDVTSLNTNRNDDCVVCGTDGVLGRGTRERDLELVTDRYDDEDTSESDDGGDDGSQAGKNDGTALPVPADTARSGGGHGTRNDSEDTAPSDEPRAHGATDAADERAGNDGQSTDVEQAADDDPPLHARPPSRELRTSSESVGTEADAAGAEDSAVDAIEGTPTHAQSAAETENDDPDDEESADSDRNRSRVTNPATPVTTLFRFWLRRL